MAKLNVSIYDYELGTDVDITRHVQSASFSESIDGTASANLSLYDLGKTHARDDITIMYDDKPLFSGIIDTQSDDLRGGSVLRRFSTWQAKDASMRMEKRVVNERYENMSVDDIVQSLLHSHPCGITWNNVQSSGRIIEEIAFPYVTLYECVSQLADIIGWRWYVDADRDLHFFDTDEGMGSIVFSTRADGDFAQNIRSDTISLRSYINDRTANRVWVVGARQASVNYIEQYHVGDGHNAIFYVPFTPNYPRVYENNVELTIDLDRGTSTDKDYLYDKENRTFKRMAGALPAGVELRIQYRPETQTIDYFENPSNIAKYGIYEKAIKDRTITEKMAARSRGRAELRRRADTIREITFDTRELGVERGKRYRIVIPELSIDSDWLCTEVTTNIAAPDRVNVVKTVTMEEIL